MILHNDSNPSAARHKRLRVKKIMPPKSTCLAFLLLLLSCLFFSPAVVSCSSLSSSNRRRRPKLLGHLKQQQNSASQTPHTSKCGNGGRCNGQAVVPTHRKACGLYIWDVPSALLYKWCHYLLKDRIYEGRGGYLFVRYESNSILKLLYPCSRYSPNKCMICGGSYADHLELWWSKHLYSPFDQYLDNTYNEALTIRDEEDSGAKKTLRNRRRNNKGNKKKGSRGDKTTSGWNAAKPQTNPSNNSRRRSFFTKESSAPPMQTLSDPPTFCFHKRYVEDVSDIVRGIRDPKERSRLVNERLPPSKQKNNFLIPNGKGVTYVAPNVGGYNKDTTHKQYNYTRKDSIIDICAVLVHSCIDSTINLQHWEFSNKKRQNSKASNRLMNR